MRGDKFELLDISYSEGNANDYFQGAIREHFVKICSDKSKIELLLKQKRYLLLELLQMQKRLGSSQLKVKKLEIMQSILVKKDDQQKSRDLYKVMNMQTYFLKF